MVTHKDVYIIFDIDLDPNKIVQGSLKLPYPALEVKRRALMRPTSFDDYKKDLSKAFFNFVIN
jgi:hypothetical protein